MRLRRSVRVLLSALIALAATLVMVGAGATPVAAAGGLDVTSTYTYTVDPAANVVRVVAEMSFRNTVPNRTEGNIIRQTYFDGFSLPLPVEAVDVVATQSGRLIPMTPRFVDGNTNFFLADIEFAANLFVGKTADIVVSYNVASRPPRDPEPTRVNAAYAAFYAFGIADPGRLTVRVVVPVGYVIETFGDDAEETFDGVNTIYTATDIESPDEFELFVSARNDDGLAVEDHTVGSNNFTIRSWPGDVEWRDFVVRHLDEGLPAMESLIGQPWPEPGTIEITEAVTAYLYGYAGWYDATNEQLEIGEDTDPTVVMHELAHAWFNDRWFSDRWISEGFAEQYADLVNQQLGHADLEPDPIAASAAGAQSLNTWGDVSLQSGSEQNDAEDFGYNASWFVIDGIVDDIGVEKMRDVLAAIDAGDIPYVGDEAAEHLRASGDWRRFLDVLERVGGSTVAADLYEQYVVTPQQLEMLEERTAAQAAYDGLEAAGGEWAPPYAVRKLMASWLFEPAERIIDQSTAALADRDELAATFADIGITMDSTFEQSYEAETVDLDDTIELIGDTQIALDGAIERRESALAGLAALGVEPTESFAATYVTASSSVADVERELGEIDAATAAVADAIEVDAESRSFYEQVGLYGDDVDAIIAEAKAALASGDTELATAKSAEAVEVIADSEGLGKTRVLTAAAIAGAVLFVLIGLIVWRRRVRRRRRAAVEADADPSAGTDLVVDADPAAEPAAGSVAGTDLVADPAGDTDPDTPREPADTL